MTFKKQIKKEIGYGINDYFHVVYPYCEDYPAAMDAVFIRVKEYLITQFERELDIELKLFVLDQRQIDVLIANTKEYLKQLEEL